MTVRILKRLALTALLVLPALGALADPPPGYYDSVDFTSPATLRQSVHDVIDGHTRFPYTASSTDTWDILNQADEDPYDSGRILDLYRNRVITKYTGGNNYYNREHSWPNSYGFPDDGSSNYAYTDCHHLFLCDISYNGYRGSLVFDDCVSGCTTRATDFYDGVSGTNRYNGSVSPVGHWETWDGRKGDVARAMFYMDVRYAGDTGSEPDLILTDDLNLIVGSQTGNNESVAYMGVLTTLIQWHKDDPVDQKERDRNDVIYTYQGNRNPFIDNPGWVAGIFEGKLSAVPELPVPATAIGSVYPNPFNPATRIAFSVGEAGPVAIEIYGLDGRRVRTLADGQYPTGEHSVVWRGQTDAGTRVPSGAWFVRLRSGGSVDVRKVLLLK